MSCGRRSSWRRVAVVVIAGVVLAGLPVPVAEAATWQPARDLSVAGEVAGEAQVAIDGNGDAVAAWRRYDGSRFRVQAASRPAGGSWSAPVTLSAYGFSAGLPQVAIDGRGDAVVVWQFSDGANERVQAVRRTAGRPWSHVVTLSAAGTDAVAPQLASNNRGDAVAVWQTSDGTNERVQAAFRRSGGSWSAAGFLSAAGQNADSSDVALDRQGGAVAVWERSGAHERVQTARRTAGGSWLPPVTLSTAGRNAVGPRVAVDGAGDAVVVWQRFDGANFRIQAVRHPFGGHWSRVRTLSAAGEETAGAQIALDRSGDAVAVWQCYVDQTMRVQEARRPAGRQWSAVATLSAAGQDAFDAQVAIDAHGQAVAVWKRYDGTHNRVQAASQ